jgi:PhzF family phenazine biosynthesis protein
MPTPTALPFHLVDVFSATPYSGNSLTVFKLDAPLTTYQMQRITQEMRQFETILLEPLPAPDAVRAHIFTMEEELDFAGHPVLGAAAVLHQEQGAPLATWQFHLNRKVVTVTTEARPYGVAATMDQGIADFGAVIPDAAQGAILAALNLTPDDRAPGLPLQVVSTGLAYLLVPIRTGFDRARIVQPDFGNLLARQGAQFVYVLDVARREGRTWDNAGLVEDIATGSAAGPTGAYLVRYGLAPREAPIELRQGRFLDRPSVLTVSMRADGHVFVSGDVVYVAAGVVRVAPAPGD